MEYITDAPHQESLNIKKSPSKGEQSLFFGNTQIVKQDKTQVEDGANSTCNTAATDATTGSGDQTKKTDNDNALDEDLTKRMDDFFNLININIDEFTSDDSDNEDQSKDTKDSENSSDEAVPKVCRLNLKLPVVNNNN